jgi:WD40 repeat protein
VSAIATAPNGAELAKSGEHGALRVWDVSTRKVTAVMRVDDSLKDCAWNPDGDAIAAVGDADVYLFSFAP